MISDDSWENKCKLDKKSKVSLIFGRGLLNILMTLMTQDLGSKISDIPWVKERPIIQPQWLIGPRRLIFLFVLWRRRRFVDPRRRRRRRRFTLFVVNSPLSRFRPPMTFCHLHLVGFPGDLAALRPIASGVRVLWPWAFYLWQSIQINGSSWHVPMLGRTFVGRIETWYRGTKWPNISFPFSPHLSSRSIMPWLQLRAMFH